VDADRSFSLAISAAGFASPAAVDSAIIDDESGISIALTSAATEEGNSGVATYLFTVTRQGVSAAVDVDWVLSGLGVNGVKASDFPANELPSGRLSFANGEMTKDIVIEVQSDTVVEPDELMRVTLTGTSDPAQRILVAFANATVVNDDLVSPNGSTIETGDGSNIVLGGEGNDIILGGLGSSVIYAGAGDDVIYAGGGADRIYGGAGDDTIHLNADNLEHFSPQHVDLARTFVDGGVGFDTVVFNVSGTTIDLSAIMVPINGLSGLRSIERIDVTSASGQPGNTLKLDASALGLQDEDVFDIGGGEGFKQLMVKGSDADAVQIADFGYGWDVYSGLYQWENDSYRVYVNDDLKLQLLVLDTMLTITNT